MNVRSQPLINWLLTAGFAGVILTVWWIGHSSLATEDYPADLAVSSGLVGNTQGSRILPALIARPVTGNWTGSINLGNQKSDLRFSMAEQGGQLRGTVHFPVGNGIIQSGSRINNQISMTTLNHVPASGQPLLTEFRGTYEGDVMRLVMKTETGNDELILQRAP